MPDKTNIAKLFMTGGSQAVRLPAEFRFDAEQVYVRRDERTGDVILSAQPRSSWSDFLEARSRLGPVPSDFMTDRAQPSESRDPFATWPAEAARPRRRS